MDPDFTLLQATASLFAHRLPGRFTRSASKCRIVGARCSL